MKINHKISWLIIGVSVFIVLLWTLDFRHCFDQLIHVHITWLSAGLILMPVLQVVGYLKWKVMYETIKLPDDPPLLPIFTSVLVTGMITPARSGDVIASLTWNRVQGKVLACSVFHRISEGTTTLVLSFFMIVILARDSSFVHIRWFAFISFCLATIVLTLIVFNPVIGRSFFKAIKQLLNQLTFLPFFKRILTFEEKIKEQFELFYDGMMKFKQKHTLTPLIAITLLSRLIIIIINILILKSLSVDLSVIKVLGILASKWVSSFLAPTPNGIGIGDISPALLLSHFGFPESAGAYIVIGRLIDISVILFWSGILAFFVKRKTLA